MKELYVIAALICNDCEQLYKTENWRLFQKILNQGLLTEKKS